MENVFEILINKLLEVGFYDLLIFLIALAVFYGILQKIKFFEGSRGINAILAFSIAFLIFGFPIIVNYSMVLPMAKFFTQSFVFILVFLVGTLVATFFYPDLPKFLLESITSRSTLYVSIAIGLAVAITSGAVSVLWATTPIEEVAGPVVPADTTLVAAGVIIFVILIIVAGSIALRGGG